MLIVVAVCAACGSHSSSSKTSSSKISAGTYVSALCSAISPLENDVRTRTAALKKTAATSAEQAKKNLRGFGTPNISGGDAVAAKIVGTFTQLRNAMRAAVAKSDSLPTNSPSSFQTAAQSLLASVGASLNQIDSSGLSNPDVEKAEAAQSACKQLSSG
jgi:hypothetical protein